MNTALHPSLSPRQFLTLPLLIVTLLLVACSGATPNAVAVATNTLGSPTPHIPSNGISAQAESSAASIIAAMHATINSPAFSRHIQVFDTTNQLRGDTLVAHVLPDRYLKKVGTGSEVIIISTTTYLLANGAWTKSVVTATDALSRTNARLATDTRQIDALAKAMRNSKVIGPDTVDGIAMTAYQYETQARDGSITVNKVWIGDADHLLHKREYITEAKKLKGTVTYQYDGVKIDAPIP